MAQINIMGIVPLLIKVLLEGLAVALAAYLIPSNPLKNENIVAIALSAAVVFFLLDLFAPEIGLGTRQGAGFGLGAMQVGFGRHPFIEDLGVPDEGFEDCKIICQTNPSDTKCLPNRACHNMDTHQRGGSEPLEIGTDVQGQTVKYQSGCLDYYVDTNKRPVPCLKDTDNQPNFRTPYGLRSKPPSFSPTNVMGRKMNFPGTGCPVNSNVNDYKLVPTQYGRLSLQSGYSENVKAYDCIKGETYGSNWKEAMGSP